MLEKRRCWAWVPGYDGDQPLLLDALEDGRYILRAVVGFSFDSGQVVEIPDAVWLKRYKSDLRDLARAAMVAVDYSSDSEWREAKAVIEDIAPRYTTEAAQ